MENTLPEIQDIAIDGGSRSARWKSLRKHLRQIVRTADESSDKLAALETEIVQIREANFRLSEYVQTLADLANEEVQREISLTLNDVDCDIVVDAPVQDEVLSAEDGNQRSYAIPEFLQMVKGAPGIGEKKLQAIAEYLEGKESAPVQPALLFDCGEGDRHGK